jgi:H+/Cl- antiporter ClcA
MSRSEASMGRRRFSVASFAAVFAIAATVTALALLHRFAMERTYADFGIFLPPISQWMMDATRLFRFGGWTIVWAAPFAAGFLVPLFLPQRELNERRVRRWMFLAVLTFLVILAIVIVFTWSVQLPLERFEQSYNPVRARGR